MKPHRIFIAINLREDVKEELLAYRERWPELPARWTCKENLHLTLAFLGNTSDQELAEVCELMKLVGERHRLFPLKFTKIVYGPLKATPRMIWAMAESQELLVLQKDVEVALSHSAFIHYEAESRPFSPHLTLAKLNTFQLQHFEMEELPEVNEEISLEFEVRSIEVMESVLKRSGAEYAVVGSFALKEM